MNILNLEYFWFLLFLLPLFIKKDFRTFRFTLIGYILTFIFIVLALSRPVVEQEPIKSKQILSDVVVAVDLSFSMYADDIKPSRIKKAKEVLNLDEFNKTMEGIVTNHDSSTLDEAPLAYKNIYEVMELQKDLVEIVDQVKPILNIKG